MARKPPSDPVEALIRHDGLIPGHKDNAALLKTLGREDQARLVAGLAARLVGLEREIARLLPTRGIDTGAAAQARWTEAWSPRDSCEKLLRDLLRRKLPLTEEAMAALLEWVAGSGWINAYTFPLGGIASAAESLAEAGLAGDRFRAALQVAIAKLRGSGDADARKAADRLAALVAGAPVVQIEPGEAWSDVALADLAAMPADDRRRWEELLAHAQATGGKNKVTARWLDVARKRVEAVGFPAFKAHILRWFPPVDRPRTLPFERQNPWEPDRTDLIQPTHADILKGLAWCCGLFDDRALARAITALAVSAYRKVPGKGPRLVTLGNACVAALGMMPGTEAVGALAVLKVKVKFGTAQKEVEKALTAAASREGLPREEIEELGVPSYGLEEVGRRRETFGEYAAELVVDGSDAEVRWSRADGKPLKAVPAAVKKEHGEALKDLQGAAKDVARMLGAQRERLDGLFLARKAWPFDAWRERYLDHPLVGTIARRLIWSFTTGGRTEAGIAPDGRPVGRDGAPLEGLGGETTVAPWHPIDHPTDDVLAWRARLEALGVRQPFKQAHREVYVLTDAERATRVYSNRFAAHVLRQHQFHALCEARGWKDKLRLMVDDEYPPASRDLPAWGLRAEYWVEGAGDQYGRDTNETGTYLHLTTDQVRFYEIAAPQRTAHAGGGGYRPAWRRADAEPLPLERVPPLVFSEVMRDVDLFVGVASVGNDPTWNDGGPDGRYVDYWQRYSFGDLSATGQTRKAVLQRLIPRLKIADRCSFADRFLVVRGDLRTYKIHLGSGNILMEPDDRYLCIVPKRGASGPDGPVFLPFEGDGTLSVILSKALLLAADAKITDPTITSQIRP
jgi:hypothetical protein